MIPNKTKLKVLAGVLRLEDFTVADLCLHTGLTASMVYRELANLQNEGTLTSISTVEEGKRFPQHRPRKRYQLASNPAKRDELRREIASFLPEQFEEPITNRHFENAQALLTMLADEFLAAHPSSMTKVDFASWQKSLLDRFEKVGEELRRATWESEVDFSEENAANHPIAVATRLYTRLRGQFEEQVRKENFKSRGTTRIDTTTAYEARIPAVNAAHRYIAMGTRYIAVEGPMGVGKSTLAQLLAERLNAQPVLEAEDNPFLRTFYEGEPGAAFRTQFAFLIRRFRQLRALQIGPLSQKTVVTDFIFEKDKIFACLNLTDQELYIYNQYYNDFREQLPTPDLVIYLHATPEVVKKRLKEEKAASENAINEDYLEEVIKAYDHFFFHYTSSDLLIINASEADFIERSNDLRELLREVSPPPKGAQTFLPGRSAEAVRA